jgi:hypothetical protein
MAWFISPSTAQQESGVTDFYLGRRTVTVQTTANTTGYAFVQQLTSEFAYQSSVPGSIIRIPPNSTVELNLSNYPAGYYRVVAGTSFTPDNYLSQSGNGNIYTPALPVIYRTFVTDTYTLPTPPLLTVSISSFPYLQLQWNQQDPSATLKAEWRAIDDLEFTTVDQLTGTSYLAEPFEYGGRYEVRLSVKSALSGEYSLPTTLLITYPLGTLATPDVIVTPSPFAVKVEWAPVPNAARYHVRYKLHITADAWVIRTITDTQFTISDLDPFTQYDIQIVAQADGFLDSFPYTVLLTTLGTLSPVIPVFEKQYPLFNTGHWEPSISPSVPISYEVRYNTVDDFETSLSLNTFSSPSFIHHVPTSDTLYFYWIRPTGVFAGISIFGDWAVGSISGIPSTFDTMSYRIHLDVTDYPETDTESPFSVEVDWGDSTISRYSDLTSMPDLTHDYSESGTYSVVFSLTNRCGTTRTRTEITLHARYSDNPANTLEQTSDLVITDISASDTIDDNIPPIELTGEIRRYLLETGEYGYETVIHSSLELIQFPTVYELIPTDQLVLGDDPASNMSDYCTEHLEYAVSTSAPPDSYAVLFADVSFSLVFNYIDLLTQSQLYFNTFDVTIHADAAFFARCSCAEHPIIDPIDQGDGTLTGTISFDGKHIAGFQFEIASGNTARLHQVVINVLQPDGSVSRISNNVLDVYAVSFISNKHALLDTGITTPSVVSGYSAGYISIISTFDIDHVEVLCNASVKDRILADSFRIVGSRHLLTIKNTGGNPQEIQIPITTGKTGQIDHIQAFSAIPPDLTNLPILFRQDINALRTHNTYFYQLSPPITTLISQDTFSSPLPDIIGTGTLQTLYGTVTFSFYPN